ncbi:TetR/AcrR family transcriptional regulator [Maridesulfovibrio ferrireducens]|uniref:TetR/AcrR family transcriptional regulator n=1 Tax=Maridesulfovibrio ferrireducens TaxID=246191 RepID=UPI001A2C00EB|nr:TetR/AcrR family transcriptional regulator [Maridesulfovibrio ferrireducens]MBI9111277.1 TetR/AcrR family transcriptional regulator [Maridesulfovibrio ferrireducens]
MTKKEKIFNAGAKLFAERSFNSVGIRDIAREAEVNSAMISYYFGGKTGLLREIFSSFVDLVLAVVKKSMDESADHYELCDNNVRRFIDNARKNRDVYLVGLRELNHDSPDLQDLRDTLQATGWEYFSNHLSRMGSSVKHPEIVRDITFTAVMGIIFSDYLLGGGTFIDNDELVETYKGVISSILRLGTPELWK